jgi:hypothetical protein
MKNRTISKEPTVMQWLQQDLRALIELHLRCHPEIPVRLHRQDISRQVALRGSRSGGWDTIDLSSASDYVSRNLLEELLAETPLLYPLLATRTGYVEASTVITERLRLTSLN